MSTKKSSATTGPGPTTDATTGPLTAPVPTKTRKPRKSKSTGPAWYKVSLSDGTYRIIEADSLDDAASAVVTVFPALPQDFVQAGKDGVVLESKPIGGAA